MKCPVCLGHNNSLYDQDHNRSYFLCEDCELIFVGREQILPAIDELKRYEAHQNHENDPHYQDYLRQIVDSSLSHIKSKSQGLDFGCGKTTLLSKIFAESGHLVDSYDVFFHPSEEIWQKKYDFIVLSEVIEHLARPRVEMVNLRNLLNPFGKIFIKTKYHPGNPAAFTKWFYKRDQTHVQFFNSKSLGLLAQQLKMTNPVELTCDDLFLIESLE